MSPPDLGSGASRDGLGLPVSGTSPDPTRREELLARPRLAKRGPHSSHAGGVLVHVREKITVMKAWSVIGLLFAAAILASVPVSPQVTSRGVELSVGQAQAQTYRRARVTARRVGRRSYRYARRADRRAAYYGAAPSTTVVTPTGLPPPTTVVTPMGKPVALPDELLDGLTGAVTIEVTHRHRDDRLVGRPARRPPIAPVWSGEATTPEGEK